QPDLNLTRHGEIALQALLFASDTFIKAGILDRNCDLSSEGRERADVVVVVVVAARVFKIENADSPFLVNERHTKFGTGFRIQLDITRVLAYVRRQHRGFLSDGVADQSSSQGNVV